MRLLDRRFFTPRARRPTSTSTCGFPLTIFSSQLRRPGRGRPFARQGRHPGSDAADAVSDRRHHHDLSQPFGRQARGRSGWRAARSPTGHEGSGAAAGQHRLSTRPPPSRRRPATHSGRRDRAPAGRGARLQASPWWWPPPPGGDIDRLEGGSRHCSTGRRSARRRAAESPAGADARRPAERAGAHLPAACRSATACGCSHLGGGAQILPDHTARRAAAHQGRQAAAARRLTGFSSAAAGLVAVIDASPIFVDASLVSPIARDNSEDRERFSIQARLRPRHRDKDAP